MLLACAAHAPYFMRKAVGGGRAGKQEDAGSDATLDDVNNFNQVVMSCNVNTDYQ